MAELFPQPFKPVASQIAPSSNGGGSGCDSPPSNGGFTPPQCPIETTTTKCEPITITSCNCVNSGPRNPISPAGWQTIEVGEDGQGGYAGGTGDASYPNGVSTLNPTTQMVTLGGGPSSWAPPYYEYTGYMELRLNCSDGSYHVIDSWHTRQGGPSRNLISQAMNPCGTQGPIEDVSGRDENDCNNARTAFPDYNISYNCTSITVDQCEDITTTDFTDATPELKDGVGLDKLLQLAAAGAPLSAQQTIFKGGRLVTAVQTKLMNIMLDNPPKDLYGLSRPDVIKKLYDNLDWDKIAETYKAGPGGKGAINVVWKNIDSISDDVQLRNKWKELAEAAFEKAKPLAQEAIDNLDNLPANQKAAFGKRLADFLAKHPTLLKCSRYGAGALGIALFLSDALEASELGSSDEITWNCPPNPGGNNTGTTGSGGGLTPQGDGTFKSPNGTIVPRFNPNGGSRSQFGPPSSSNTLDMNKLNNTQIPSVVRNNQLLHSNDGFPTTSFPVLKTVKEESGIITSPGFPTPPEGMPISGPGFPTPEPIYYPFTRN